MIKIKSIKATLFPFIVAIFLFNIGCQKKNASNYMGAKTRPNVVVIFTDEIDWKYLGCYGGDRLSPNIDQLANEGVTFSNFYAVSSMCTPSRYSLLTGQYPGRCRHPVFQNENPVTDACNIAWNSFVDVHANTLARELGKQGYFTGFAGKWHLGPLEANMDFPDLDEDLDPGLDSNQQQLINYQQSLVEHVKKDGGFDYVKNVLWENWEEFPVKKLRTHHIEWMTDGALEFIDTAATRQQPFFLYVTISAIHGPNLVENLDRDARFTPIGYSEQLSPNFPTRDSIKNWLIANGKEINHINVGLAMADLHVSAIEKKLKALGLEENTLVIFAADHNVEPGKTTCYEQGLKSPVIIKWPGKLHANTNNEQRFQYTDFFPSIVEACGIETTSLQGADGKSIFPVLANPALQREYNYYETGYTRGISDGKFKYIAFRYPEFIYEMMMNGELSEAPNHFNWPGQPHCPIVMKYYPGYFDYDQLYNLQADPYEQINLAFLPEQQAKLQQLKTELKKITDTFNNPFYWNGENYMKTEAFKKLTENARANAEFPFWWKRDWKGFEWPPK